MMAREQMLRELEEVWEHLEILPVTYGPQDAATFREAMRHVQAGGVLGIFPEGGITRPPQEIRPFLGWGRPHRRPGQGAGRRLLDRGRSRRLLGLGIPLRPESGDGALFGDV
jgi:1-acyl-sn-glycerol-3-phosphate acyltransferase